MTNTDEGTGGVFPTLADGVSAAPAPSSSEERLKRLRRQSLWLAAAFIVICAFSVLSWWREAREEIFWVWVVGMTVIFLINISLWRALVREDEKKAKRIRDRDQRYRQTLALLPEGVTILGEGWRIEWVNQRALEHFNITPEVVGRSFFDAVSDERLRRWLLERNFTKRFQMKTRGDRDLDVAVVAPDSRHMMIVTHDVTERRRVDDMRRDFVANVSHELRTPLTPPRADARAGDPHEVAPRRSAAPLEPREPGRSERRRRRSDRDAQASRGRGARGARAFARAPPHRPQLRGRLAHRPGGRNPERRDEPRLQRGPLHPRGRAHHGHLGAARHRRGALRHRHGHRH